METFISSTRLRRDLTEVLVGLEGLDEPTVIVHRSHPIGIIWGYQQFQRLIERLEDAEDLLLIADRKDDPKVSFEEAMRVLEDEPIPAVPY